MSVISLAPIPPYDTRGFMYCDLNVVAIEDDSVIRYMMQQTIYKSFQLDLHKCCCQMRTQQRYRSVNTMDNRKISCYTLGITADTRRCCQFDFSEVQSVMNMDTRLGHNFVEPMQEHDVPQPPRQQNTIHAHGRDVSSNRISTTKVNDPPRVGSDMLRGYYQETGYYDGLRRASC